MMRLPIYVTAILGMILCSAEVAKSAPASDEAGLRRIALVIGANDGGQDRVKLRYATSDAQSVANVIRDLGGVSAADVDILLDPESSEIDATFAALARKLARIREGKARIELLVYYSGHSDEEGLLLSGSRYPYRKLRQQIRSLPADVHIAILDSCASGAFTRTKGGVRRPAFLVDTANQVRGHAFLSSSSADESAQESDHIGASFFTHYLLSGLRGGADSNRDGRVTLSEAYRFAYDETLASTETTRYGPQHPAYDMHLAGVGDLVMTDLRATNASLVLAADLAGRVFIRDRNGQLVVEMRKSAGAPVMLGLGADEYQVTLEQGDMRLRAAVALQSGAAVTLRAGDMEAVAREVTVARGGVSTESDGDGDDGGGRVQVVPVSIGLIPAISFGGGRTRNYLSINALVGAGSELRGLELSGVASARSHSVVGVQASGVANWVSGDVDGVQLAGVVNGAHGSLVGVQASGVVNVTRGTARGVQMAGFANYNSGIERQNVSMAGFGNWTMGPLSGVQMAGAINGSRGIAWGGQAAGFANWAGGAVSGFQLAGAGNWADGAVSGLQLSGAGNLARGPVVGAQISGMGNIASDAIDGVQVSGVFNWAAHLHGGLQLSLVNIGGDIRGAQIGLVNVAKRVEGAQVGLLNFASESNNAVGLLSVVRNGHRAAEFWADDLALANVGIKLGSRRFYTLFSAAAARSYYLAGAGIGVHNQLDGFYVDADVSGYSTFSTDFDYSESNVYQLRLMAGLPLRGGFSLFAGASLRLLVAYEDTDGGPDAEEPIEPDLLLTRTLEEGDDFTIRLSPGLFVGVAY